MFLSRMVNGLLNSNKNDNCFYPNSQSQQQPTTTTMSNANSNPPQTSSNKSKKKADKNKRINTKRSITKFFKSSPKESCSEQQEPCSSKRGQPINDGNSKPLASTKVKSGSWKRSDKTNTVLNVLSNKKSKSLRKKSPNLLAFSSNRPLKLEDKPLITTSAESNSACRPGTLYSDVLFGAAPSNFIKVKILSPRRNVCETAQKKLTKALLKYSANEKNDPTTDESEIEGHSNIFPQLNPLSHNKPSDVVSSLTSSSQTPCSGSVRTINSLDVSSNSESLTSSISSNIKSDFLEEPDVIILSEHNDGTEVGSCSVTYGNYLKQQSANTDMSCDSQPFLELSKPKSRFKIDIPSWNFTEIDLGIDGFPKFIQQFDNENYLKAEKLAMLSLDSALGHNSPWRLGEHDSGPEGFSKFLPQFNDENYLKAEKLANLGLNLVLGNISQPEEYES